MTEMNKPKVLEATNNLSMLYLMVIGERIDALSVSNLLCAWSEIDLLDHSPAPFELLKNLVVDKADQDAFFSPGCGTALVNIIKASNDLYIQDDEFINCILQGLEDHFDELDIPWATIALKNMG